MKTGETYPKGAWFYVPDNNRWYEATGDYQKESDELTEAEANERGFRRGFHFEKEYLPRKKGE